MFMTLNAFPPELADIGLAVAADPRYAERLVEALRRLADEAHALPTSDAAHVAEHRAGATA